MVHKYVVTMATCKAHLEEIQVNYILADTYGLYSLPLGEY